MIPAMSVMLPISNPEHPLFHGDCPCCQEHYNKPIPDVKLASEEDSRRAIQQSRWLIPVPRLREIREEQDSSKARLSRLSGVSWSQITKLEAGDHMAREDTALRLANALYVTVADLEGTA